MKTDTLNLSWRNDTYDRVLYLVNRVADGMELNEENRDVLVRIAEETLSMQEVIIGRYAGELNFEVEGDRCELVISNHEELAEELRDVFVRMSSSGENSYKQTLAGKVLDYVTNFITGTLDAEVLDYPKDTLVLRTKDGNIWDESECAILHHYADEIVVESSRHSLVIKVRKTFA